MPVLWHGYEQHPDAHPERPWWHKVVTLYRMSNPPVPLTWYWRRTDGRVVTASDVGTAAIDLMALNDRDHPLPAPKPRCGQVWGWPDRPFVMVVQEEYPWFPAWVALDIAVVVTTGKGPGSAMSDEWPPPGAILVAGPDAPWAPPEVVKPSKVVVPEVKGTPSEPESQPIHKLYVDDDGRSLACGVSHSPTGQPLVVVETWPGVTCPKCLKRMPPGERQRRAQVKKP